MRSRSDQRGSVLLLVPAAVLVLIILGAIAVDFALVFLSQRRLSGLASAVANDAATAALSDPRFYRGTSGAGVDPDDIEIDEAAAQGLADDAVRRQDGRGLQNIVARTHVIGGQVCVTLSGSVDHIFAKAVPGAAGRTAVKASAVATAVEGRPGTKTAPAPDCGVD